MVVLGNGQLGANAPSIVNQSSFKIVRADCAPLPQWFFTRKYLNPSLNPSYLNDNSSTSPSSFNLKKPQPLGNFNLNEQQIKLIDDFINAMSGHDGTYIRKKRVDSSNNRLSSNPAIIYAVEPFERQATCDYSLYELVTSLLPILNAHETIKDFITRHSLYEYGLVNHALSEALRTLLRSYKLLIVQLDDQFNQGLLTLQKLKHYLTETKVLLTSYQQLSLDAQTAKGGALLSIIYEHYQKQVNSSVKKEMRYLLERASLPYIKILFKWIYRGELRDSYGEFMVKENKEFRSKENIDKIYNDHFWYKRFEINSEMLPIFMRRNVQCILVTGKYLNVIRECEKVINCPFQLQLPPSRLCQSIFLSEREGNQLRQVIFNANKWASQRLIQLLCDDYKLFDRFKSVKRFFFHEQSDFIAHLLDAASQILEENSKDVSVDKLNSILEMVVRTTTANNDPFKQDIACQLTPFQLSDQVFAMQSVDSASSSSQGDGTNTLNKTNTLRSSIKNKIAILRGFEAFTLDYRVPWPLTLILSRKSLAKYQLIFRHLLNTKFIERKLGQVWQYDQSFKEMDIQYKLNQSYHLRHKMLHFIKNCIYYMTIQVLEPKWHMFMMRMEKTETIDEIMQLHDNFLDQCLKECLITDPNLLTTMKITTSGCLYFWKMLSRFHQNLMMDSRYLELKTQSQAGLGQAHDDGGNDGGLEERKSRVRKQTEIMGLFMIENEYSKMIENFEGKFEKHVKDFMEMAHKKYQEGMVDEHLLNLLGRLDYNCYYSRVFEPRKEDQFNLQGDQEENTGYDDQGGLRKQ